MKVCRLGCYAFSIATAAVALIGCSASPEAPTRYAPDAAATRVIPPATPTTGLYVAFFPTSGSATIVGYNRKYRKICSVEGPPYASGISADRDGNLIAVFGQNIAVYQGPQLCGLERGSINDPYGQPGYTSSVDALDGKIVVGNVFDNGAKTGSISVCTLATGCTEHLLNANMHQVYGVALAGNGDCWADATNARNTRGTLTYFKGCSGKGKRSIGFVNQDSGGIQIDRYGNLITEDSFNSRIYVYKGCDPKCSLVGGPYALRGRSSDGSLNAKSTMFAANDYENGQIDIYSYSPSGLSYRSSFAPRTGFYWGFLNGVSYSPSG